MSGVRVLPKSLRPVAVAFVAATSSLLIALSASGAAADPTVPEIERQMDVLAEQLNVVVEQYNDARVNLKTLRAQAAKAAERVRPLQVKVDELYARVGKIANSAYKGSHASAVNAILTGGSPGTLIDQMMTLERIARGHKSEIDGLQEAKRSLDAEKAKADDLVARQVKTEQDIAAKKAAIEKELKRLEELRQRVGTRASRDGTRVPPPPYIPGARGKIVNFAYAQLGKPYVFGADGPGSFDCSGLVLAAHRTVGITLPHSSREQYARATKVGSSQLRPGDVVWFYSDRHHNGIYVGDGMVIHAPHTGDVVKRVPFDRMGPRNGQGYFVR